MRPTYTLACSLVCLTLGAVVLVSGSSDWSYEHPEQWVRDYPDCGGQNQSPINIDLKAVRFQDIDNVRFSDLYYQNTSLNFTLKNDGHTVSVDIEADQRIQIQDGGLPGEYTLQQYHFHWGSASDKGSEHAINGKHSPAEMHFVHYRSILGNVSSALDQPDGLAVLGFMLELSDTNNTALDPIISRLTNVTFKDERVRLQSLSIMNLLPKQLGHFYRYSGSLTTPPCSEAVIWTVFEEHIKISESQLNELRSLHEGTNSNSSTISHDYRPVQPINGRTVYTNNPYYIGDCMTSAAASVWTTGPVIVSFTVLLFT